MQGCDERQLHSESSLSKFCQLIHRLNVVNIHFIMPDASPGSEIKVGVAIGFDLSRPMAGVLKQESVESSEAELDEFQNHAVGSLTHTQP